MLQGLQRVLQVPELRTKILFTLMMLCVCRIGGFIPVPGINGEIALSYFQQAMGGSQNIFQMVNMFSGGAFSNMTVIALGVVPYISASIIAQLLVATWPALQREMRENQEQGKRKLNKLIRLMTLALSFIQSTLFAKYALQMNMSRPGIITGELLDFQLFGMPLLFFIIVISTMTTGTIFLMWIGEQITERGDWQRDEPDHFARHPLAAAHSNRNDPPTAQPRLATAGTDEFFQRRCTGSSIRLCNGRDHIDHTRASKNTSAAREKGSGEKRGARGQLLYSTQGKLRRRHSRHLCLGAPHVPRNYWNLCRNGELDRHCSGLARTADYTPYGDVCRPNHPFHLLLDGDAVSSRPDRFRYEEEWSLYSRR